MSYQGTSLRLISPEYLIALKMRRTAIKGRMYGKDKLDVASLVLAHKVRHGRREVDLERASDLMMRHAGETPAGLQSYIQRVTGIENHLKEKERRELREILGAWSGILESYKK